MNARMVFRRDKGRSTRNKNVHYLATYSIYSANSPTMLISFKNSLNTYLPNIKVKYNIL